LGSTGIFSPKDVVCTYGFVAQRSSFIFSKIYDFFKYNSNNYTAIINTTAASAAALSYICPFISCAASEWFRDNSFHNAVVYDDLTKHAVSFRQVTLLLGYAPGREAYPGDVFYLHSRLLERSGKLSV